MDSAAHDYAANGAGRPAPSVGALLSGIVADVEALVRQEIALASQEVREEVHGATTAAIGFAAVVGIVAVAIILLAIGSALALAHWLDRPPWMGLFAVGGALGIGGVLLWRALRVRLGQQENPVWPTRPNGSAGK